MGSYQSITAGYGAPRLITNLVKLIYNASLPTSTAIKDDVATSQHYELEVWQLKVRFEFKSYMINCLAATMKLLNVIVTGPPGALCCFLQMHGACIFFARGRCYDLPSGQAIRWLHLQFLVFSASSFYSYHLVYVDSYIVPFHPMYLDPRVVQQVSL